jgi:DNA mismatch endonuclease (patch repair protein)
MRAVKASGNASTEMRMITILRANAITGWRRRQSLPGKPDFTFRKERVALFVDGCFWHGCPRCHRAPRERADYWAGKVAGNRRRDRRVAEALREAGWRVMRVWEHALASEPAIVARLNRMLAANGRERMKEG